MKVLFLGVGADTTNCSPTPPIHEDRRFEYIPIPESEGAEGTIETKTYGNTELRHDSGTLADYLDSVRPGGRYDEWYSGTDMEEWPLHHDPNFEALTYGESIGRPDYVNKLRLLERGDIVAFYTGLQGSEISGRARYLIGYFTIESILDLRRIQYQGDTVGFSDLPDEEQTRLMKQHSENAHAKRFLSTGTLKADDDGVVIADGQQPGGRLEKAIKISEHRGGGHHYLSDEFKSELLLDSSEAVSEEFYLGGIKQPHLIEVESDVFYQLVS